MANIKILVIRKSTLWKKYQSKIDKSFLKKIIIEVISYFPNILLARTIELSVVLSHAKHLHQLNKQFRNKDKDTDILSFAEHKIDYKNLLELDFRNSYIYIGDLVISYNNIRNDSLALDKKFESHFIHIIVHGVLHLLGFKHDKKKDAEAMVQIEQNLIKTIQSN